MAYVWRNGPIPNSKDILPFEIAIYNKLKNGVDGFSSLLKHIQPEHTVHPTCKVVLRIIRSMFYVLRACLRVVSTLRIAGDANFNVKTYHSLQKALTLIMPTFRKEDRTPLQEMQQLDC